MKALIHFYHQAFLFSLDINECAIGDHSCHVEENCENTAGSFKCNCKLGYIGNGYECFGKRSVAIKIN